MISNIRLALVFIVSLLPSVSVAAIDYRIQGPVLSGAPSITWNHITNGTNRGMLVCVPYFNAVSPTWIATYNGTIMTQLWHQRSTSGDNQGVVAFKLAAPDTGTHAVVVIPNSAVSVMTGFSLTATEVDQTSVMRSNGVTGHDTGSGTISQVVTDSQVDDLVADCVQTYNLTLSVGAGQSSTLTKDESIGGGNRSAGLSTKVATSGTTGMSWTGGAIWSGGAVAFIGGGTGIPPTACTGTSPNLIAASTSEEARQNCYDSAINGDTITVPIGTATWTNPGINKNITLKCATPPLCIINGTLASTGTTSLRVTGFTFNVAGSGLTFTAVQGFRFDHGVINADLGNPAALQFLGTTLVPAEALIDNSVLNDVRVLSYGEVDKSTTPPAQPHGNPRWSEPENLGTVHAIYLEDNIMTHHPNPAITYYPNSTDGGWGNRVVARFNRLDSGRFEVHGIQAEPYRAQRIWEFIGNSINSSLGQNYRAFFIRGGTGVVAFNNYDGGMTLDSIDIDGPRMIGQNSYTTWGFCDGFSIVDENLPTFEGARCRDQIGASTDSFSWVGPGIPVPTQLHTPAMFFKNVDTSTGLEMHVLVSQAGTEPFNTRMFTKQILQNRDYYTYDPSFTGASGIGVGPRGSRPLTCTVGTAYWSSDQGNWNTSTSNPYGVQFNGADGVLDKCTAPNVWTDAAYVPYTYPHPLQDAGASVDTTTPLRIHVVQLAQIWGPIIGPLLTIGFYFRRGLLAGFIACIAIISPGMYVLPVTTDRIKVIGKQSVIKTIEVFNHLTKPRI